MKRIVVLTTISVLFVLAGSAPAFAHNLTVDPPGYGGAVFDEPISTNWAHAHCEAAAPEVATDASDVITVTPDKAFDGCPVEPPPGQQE